MSRCAAITNLCWKIFSPIPRRGVTWRYQGGEQTLRSYGVPLKTLSANYEEAAMCLRAVLPAEQLRFLASLRLSLSHGSYFLCHAGVRPGVPLESQRDDDLLWIRDEFLGSKENFGKIVVHGHTPVVEPEILPNRINIDTGAFASGRLTCVALDEEGPRFLKV